MLGMFPHVVTVLNKVEDDDGVMYYPTIVDKALYVNIDNKSFGGMYYVTQNLR